MYILYSLLSVLYNVYSGATVPLLVMPYHTYDVTLLGAGYIAL